MGASLKPFSSLRFHNIPALIPLEAYHLSLTLPPVEFLRGVSGYNHGFKKPLGSESGNAWKQERKCVLEGSIIISDSDNFISKHASTFAVLKLQHFLYFWRFN